MRRPTQPQPQTGKTCRGRAAQQRGTRAGLLVCVAGLALSNACGRGGPERIHSFDDPDPATGGDPGGSGGNPLGSGGTVMATGGDVTHAPSTGGLGGALVEAELYGPPLIFNPTTDGFGINVVLGANDGATLSARVRLPQEEDWVDLGSPMPTAHDVREWMASGLLPGERYQYQVRDGSDMLYEGSAVTQRGPGMEYTFALITDSHVPPRDVPAGSLEALDFTEETLLRVGANVAADNPDFLVNLGDMLDFHLFGFNNPPPDGSYTRLAYLNYRRLLHYSLGEMAHFPVVGNWEGENGNYTPEQIAYSREQRLLYAPAPGPETYPQGGNESEDYYAFTWGDALFVVLNVMTYTPTAHLLSASDAADDWTLGAEQLTWLETTLAQSVSKWNFVLIHHAVGGAAADAANAGYGRGGGQAAMVGEQAIVHQMMLDHGVQIFFYGHDHVFTDIVVDGIHYTLPGSAGAPWKFESDETGYTQYWTDSGHGVVSVSPDKVRVEFLGLEKQLLHSYEITQ